MIIASSAPLPVLIDSSRPLSLTTQPERLQPILSVNNVSLVQMHSVGRLRPVRHSAALTIFTINLIRQSLASSAYLRRPGESTTHMQSLAPTRLAAILSLACVPCLLNAPPVTAQTKPSAAPAASSVLPATQPPHTPSQQEPRRAQVAYANALLSISAENSSLNQILRQISHETGLQITGGVADERVFGQYGPAALSEVLASLLAGTGSNMLIVHRDRTTAAQLILTPRVGGPTPPNPNANMFDEQREERPEPEQSQEPVPPTSAPARQNQPPGPASSYPTGTAPSDSSQPESPNGVKTPQQIYDQLQRMRQQQQTSPQ